MLARLDHALLVAMRTRLHGPRLELAARLLGRVGEYAAVWVLIGLAGALLASDDSEQWLVCAALGPAAVGVNFLVKLVVRRARPVLEGLPPLAGAPSSLSFPSAHTTSSFAAAVAITRLAPDLATAVFSLAVALALTRPYLGMHYPSDVLGGAVLGTALGLAVPLDVLS